MTALVLYALLTPALFYLGSQALITRWLWSRYPKWLDKFMSCPACVGFWYGLGLGFALGWGFDLTFLGLSGRCIVTPIVVAFCSIVWTPIVSYQHLVALTAIAASAGVDADPSSKSTEEDSSARDHSS